MLDKKRLFVKRQFLVEEKQIKHKAKLAVFKEQSKLEAEVRRADAMAKAELKRLKRTEAAKRGWETRKETTKQRSERAKLGWKTRKETKEQRSDRAKLGWDTRRANQKKKTFRTIQVSQLPNTSKT